MKTRATACMLASAVLLTQAACERHAEEPAVVGTLEMVEVNLAPLQTSRAVRVLVREGDTVHVGDTLAVFTIPTINASAAQANARAAAAREGAREVTSGSRPAEIARAEAELRAATSEADRAASDLARFEPLARAGDIPLVQLDAARNNARVAASRRDAAQQALRLLREGARTEQRAAATAESDAAAAAALAVRASMNDLVLISPMNGIVTSRDIEPGEVITTGGSAITVGQPRQPWARVYVSQFALRTLKIGDSLQAMLDGDSARFTGRIAAIASSAEFTPRVALTERERADLLFGVRVEFSDSTGRLKAGLPITVLLPPSRR